MESVLDGALALACPLGLCKVKYLILNFENVSKGFHRS